MSSKTGLRMRNILERIPTGHITHNNEKIKLSIATKVDTKSGPWTRPDPVVDEQAATLWHVIDQNKAQLRDGTIEISQREGVHRSDADPRDHLTCAVANKDGSVTTDHFAIQKKADKSDDKNASKSTNKDAEKKTGKGKAKK